MAADFDEAREAVRRALDEGLTFLLDGDEPAIAAGNGTLAIELTDTAERGELPSLANVYIPVGNGSLIIGVGRMAAGRCTGLPGRGHQLRCRALDDLLLAGGPAHRDGIGRDGRRGHRDTRPGPAGAPSDGWAGRRDDGRGRGTAGRGAASSSRAPWA